MGGGGALPNLYPYNLLPTFPTYIPTFPETFHKAVLTIFFLLVEKTRRSYLNDNDLCR